MSDAYPRLKHEASMTELLALAMEGKLPPAPVDEPVAEAPPVIDPVARLRAIAAVLAESGWPARALESAVVADEARGGVAAVSSWLESDEVLVLSGGVGSGKTVAACWWAMRCRRAASFVRAAELARTSRYDAARFGAIIGAPALCVDDLGAEYLDAKGSFLVDLDELVDRFYAERKPLLITTNLSGAEFAQRYGRRIIDRVSQSARWVQVGDKSLRRRA